MSDASPNGKLKRALSYSDLVFYGLAYTAPVAPLTMAGFVWTVSGGLPMLAYVLGALCVYFTASSYAVMTSAMPSAGSVYGFASQTMGRFAGFIAGWMILLDYLLVPAFTYALCAVSLEELLPHGDRATWIVATVAATFAVNWFGISVTSRVSFLSVVLQLLAVLVIVGMCLFALFGGHGSGALTLAPLIDAGKFHGASVLAATSICVMSYLGFDAVSTLAEEVKDGNTRVVGEAIMTNLAITSGIFVLTSWVVGNLLVGFPVQDPATAIYELLTAIAGHKASLALAWFLILVVGVPNVLPMQVGVARVLFAMGRDRSLPSVLAKVHHRHGNPYVAMIVSTTISLGIALLMRNNISDLAIFISVGALVGFLFVHLSVLAHFGRHGGRRWWAHVIVPLCGLSAVLTILINLNATALTVGGCWFVAGLGYWLFSRRSQGVPRDVFQQTNS
ncbi:MULTISPECIES: APC family permease [unclassified Duganella]|uniref:APC family permease n=1 Tax=unclassified Duganella TaxID=2636909 RepID=UPI000E34FAB4|nr:MULTISPECIES: APC family permease [unclassified Duganella]RFP19236.1 APC family permease [Duganella sp. BJB475]RFP35817.1 APC family permease [Duganella sp. BJB476]